MIRVNAPKTKKPLRRSLARRTAAVAVATLLCLQALPAQALTGADPQNEPASPAGATSLSDGVTDSSSVTPRAGELTLTLSSVPSSVRTYTDPQTNVGPERISFDLNVTCAQAGMEGVTIEVPYGFIPNGAGIWQNFNSTQPLYTFVEPDTLPSIVDRYEQKADKLIIHLNSTTVGAETIHLSFALDASYEGRIPAGQIVWQGLQATAKDNAGTNIATTAGAPDVRTSASDGMSVSYGRMNPSDDKLLGNTIMFNATFRNDLRQFSLLDGTKENKVYIEVPNDSELSDSLKALFGTTPTTSGDGIPAGYVRYYCPMTDTSSFFTDWESAGNQNQCARLVQGAITLQNERQTGQQVHIKVGMIYTKENGAEITNKVDEQTYTKSEQEDWQLTPVAYHNNGTGTGETVVVQGQGSQQSVKSMLVAGNNPQGYSTNTRNSGKSPIENVKVYLEQPTAGSGKVNFDTVTVYAVTENSSVQRAHYKVGFEIVNARTNATRTDENGGSTNGQASMAVNLPTLAAGEYINKVIITPMGTDGQTEGVLPSGNSFMFTYRAKKWDNDTWPDGSSIPLNTSTLVAMTWHMDYDDETSTPATFNGNTGYVYYAPAYAVDASVALVSNHPAGKPGDIVQYEVQGRNGLQALAAWENPEICIAVPKVLELQDVDEPKDFVDRVANATYPGAVKATYLSTDDTYTYYKLNVTGSAQKNTGSLSFSIPLSFKIADATPVDSYPIGFATASHAPSDAAPSFVQLNRETNTGLSDAQAQVLGYDGNKNSYSVFTAGHTPLSVTQATLIQGSTAAFDEVTGEWVEAQAFAVDNGDTPRVRARIENSGNTDFGSIRLYSVLPYDGSKHTIDGVEYTSTGSLCFAGLESTVAGETVYYTTEPVENLPSCEVADIASWDAQTLANYGFSTQPPDDPAAITAAFIDFGTAVIKGGEVLDNIPTFLVPEGKDQVAYIEFKCTARSTLDNTPLVIVSEPFALVTAHATLGFEENLPEFLLPGETHATNMPQDTRVLLDLDGTAKVTVPAAAALGGYRFLHWQDAEGAVYSPGEVATLTVDGLRAQADAADHAAVLQAVWAPKQVAVSFDANYNGAPAPERISCAFGGSLSAKGVASPARAGYRFVGWATAPDAATPDFPEGARVDFEDPQTFYAVWEQLPVQAPGQSAGSSTAVDPLNPSASDVDGGHTGVLLPQTGDAPVGAALAGLGALAALAAAVARRRGHQA